MKALDRLRMIVRNQPDREIIFHVEMWISNHCLELSNSIAIGHEDQKQDGALEFYSKKSLMMMASKIVDEAPVVEDKLWIEANKNNTPIKKYTRTVCVIRESP